MDAFMEELRRFDTHGTLCTTPLLLNLMLSEYLRHEAIDSAIQFNGAFFATLSGHSASRGPNTLLPFCDAAFMTAQHVRPQTPSNFLPCHGPVLTAARKLGRPHRGRPDRVRRLLPGRALPRVGARDAGHVGQERRLRLRSPGQRPVRRPRPRPRSSWQVFLSELPVRTSGRGQTW